MVQNFSPRSLAVPEVWAQIYPKGSHSNCALLLVPMHSLRQSACLRPQVRARRGALQAIPLTPAAAPAPGANKPSHSSSVAEAKEQQQHAWDVAGAVVRPAFRARPWDYQEQQQGANPAFKAAAAPLPRTKVRFWLSGRWGWAQILAFCSAPQRGRRKGEWCAAACGSAFDGWVQSGIRQIYLHPCNVHSPMRRACTHATCLHACLISTLHGTIALASAWDCICNGPGLGPSHQPGHHPLLPLSPLARPPGACAVCERERRVPQRPRSQRHAAPADSARSG